MTTTHLILVPGSWLGGWAWDDVLPGLRAAGLVPHPVTLPGLDPSDDASAATRADHVRAVVELVDRIADDGGDVVLVGHSGGGAVVGEVVDRRPDRVRRAVYVDSGPLADGNALVPDLPADSTGQAFPSWEELADGGSSLEGLDDAALERLRERALPHPAGVARAAVHVSDERRFAVPVTAICTSLPSEVLLTMIDGGPPLHTELGRYDVTYVDLPTGHWPMFSRPDDLAAALVDAARA